MLNNKTESAQQVPADGEWRARDVRYVIAALQSTRDRMMASLTPKFGDALDGDFDVMLDAINELKRWATRLAATPQAPQPVVDGTIGQQAVDDACNCPGGTKPASLHAPNCPVRTTENK